MNPGTSPATPRKHPPDVFGQGVFPAPAVMEYDENWRSTYDLFSFLFRSQFPWNRKTGNKGKVDSVIVFFRSLNDEDMGKRNEIFLSSILVATTLS